MLRRSLLLDTLTPAAFSPLRTAGMIALRGYLLIAVIMVGVEIFEQISS
ncbi:hypothetical protein [Nocardia sp. NPDC051570]